MYRRPLFVANWNAYPTASDAVITANHIARELSRVDDVDVVVLPPTIWIPTLVEALHHRPRSLSWGIQHFSPSDTRPMTGEITLPMLSGLVSHALVGHSDRRRFLSENQDQVQRKLASAVAAGFKPILCVSELAPVTLKERGRGRPTVTARESDLSRQLARSLDGIQAPAIEDLTIVYEPIWASEHGVPGSEVAAVAEQLRLWLSERYSPTTANRVRILYGGPIGESVLEYIRQPQVDGIMAADSSMDGVVFASLLKDLADDH